MKTRLTFAIAALLATSLTATAFAQVPPQSPTPQQQPLPQQQAAPPAQMRSLPPPAATAAANATQAPQANAASSQKIDHAIKHALTQDGVTATAVHVAFANGTATLTGSVYSQRDIAKAKHAAAQVAGVTQVDVSGLHARKG